MSEAMRNAKFARSRAFSLELEAAVDAWFRDRGYSRKANGAMVRKTILLLLWTAGSYALVISPGVPWSLRYVGCIALALGYAGVGMSIGHDALHGAYSERPWVNRLLGYTFDLLGASSYMWRYTHNVAHHSYTNIDGLDPDIEYGFVLRVAPSARLRPFHRAQSWYAFLLYALYGLHWIYWKDFSYFRRRSLGPYTNLRHSFGAWAGFLCARAFSLGYTVVIPLLLLRPTWWQFALGYVTTVSLTGFIMAVVFQMAHNVEGVEVRTLPPERRLQDDFLTHQIRTTSNFACSNRLLSWYVGHLNFQIEHHLFPQVCSVHYPALRPIVRDIAARHGLPYHELPTLSAALSAHVRLLQRMGAQPA